MQYVSSITFAYDLAPKNQHRLKQSLIITATFSEDALCSWLCLINMPCFISLVFSTIQVDAIIIVILQKGETEVRDRVFPLKIMEQVNGRGRWNPGDRTPK